MLGHMTRCASSLHVCLPLQLAAAIWLPLRCADSFTPPPTHTPLRCLVCDGVTSMPRTSQAGLHVVERQAAFDLALS